MSHPLVIAFRRGPAALSFTPFFVRESNIYVFSRTRISGPLDRLLKKYIFKKMWVGFINLLIDFLEMYLHKFSRQFFTKILITLEEIF